MEFLSPSCPFERFADPEARHSLRVESGGERLSLSVVSFEGEEGLSTPFRFDVVVVMASEAEARTRELLGAPAELAMRQHDEHGGRTVRGVVTEVRTGLAASDEGSAHAVIRIAPRVALAAHRRDTRVFQDLSVPACLSRVLRSYDVELSWRVAGAAPARSYCVQYEESDLDFVQRVLAEEGLSWFTEATAEGRESLAVVDGPSGWRPIAGDPLLPYVEHSGVAARADRVSSFEATDRVGVGAVALRGYDLTCPTSDLDASARVDRALDAIDERDAELYLHHDDSQEPDVRRSRAVHRLAQARREVELAEGRSGCERLAPGRVFVLSDHRAGSLDRRWVVTRLSHKGRRLDGERGSSTAEASDYENSFRCAPAERACPPAVPSRRIVQVTETATVTGPSGEEIHTDGLGRVKVRFHWDRRARRETDTSCWVPVAQSWAGAGFGAQFIPRVGMEVIVSFLGGDPDRPIVVGCLPSAAAPPPFALPENKTRSGIRTRTSPEGHTGNELMFEDLSGREELGLFAKRDLSLRASRDAEHSVGGELRVQVGGDHVVSTAGAYELSVDGVVRTQAGVLRHDETLGAHLSHVGGRRAEEVAGDWSAAAGGALSLRSHGHATMSAGGGEDEATLTLRATGDVEVSSEECVEITARTRLVLRCGESSIVLTPEGVEILAPKVTVRGEAGVRAEGASSALSLGDEEALVVSRRVRMFSRDASVTLDRDASVRGREVLLNCDTDEAPGAEPEPDEPERKALKLRVTDTSLAPLARCHYHVVARGETLRGVTDEEGRVSARVLARARQATVTVWTADYPRGPRREWVVSLEDVAPATKVEGVKSRLRNLGWFDGTVDAIEDDTLRDALGSFQREQGLVPTGVIDDPTRARLVSLHGG